MFVLLGIACYGNNTLNGDLHVAQWIQARNASWADPIATVGNTIGEAPVAIGLLVISLMAVILLKRWQDLWFLIVVAIGRLFAVFLKGWFDSPRPTAEQGRLQGVFDGYGFPSGHTLTSTLVAGSLAYLIIQHVRLPAGRGLLGIGWLGAVCCTAFARIWVGAHWLTDTIGGALFGVFIVLLAATLSALLVRRWPGSAGAAD